MNDTDYKPIRVIGPIGAVAATKEELKESYPNGTIVAIPQKFSGGAASFQVTYKPGSVIDAPSDAERALFDTEIAEGITAGATIPQTAPGYDDPASGLARKPSVSMRGYRKFLESRPPVKPKKKSKKAKPADEGKSKVEVPDPVPDGEAVAETEGSDSE